MATPAHIVINGRFLTQKATGVQKYALGITRALQANNPNIIIVAPHGAYNTHGLTVKKWGIGQGFFWEQFCLPLYMSLQRYTLLLNLCNTAPLALKNQVVTIHDLAFTKDEAWFSASFRWWYNFLIPRLCKKAALIFTVSDFIKEAISNTYNIPENRIAVIPNGCPDMPACEAPPYPFGYLLLTGVYNKRKNAASIIKMLPDIKAAGYHLVGTGSQAAIYGTHEPEADSHLHLLPYTDDTTYYTLLKNASALVFPSTYEGFGIPVLEALLSGIPVIVPDLPFYHSSFGDLPLYYNSGDTDSFLEALSKINIYIPDTKALNDLKNKYNFTVSAEKAENCLKNIQK